MDELKHKIQKKNRGYFVHSSLVSYYLLVMFSFFTLFLTHQYASARRDKFFLFLGLTGALVVFAPIAYLISRNEDKRNRIETKPFFKPISSTDIAFFAFFGFALISAAFSPHASDTVMASIARNNGLVLLLAYTLMYLIITRMYVYKDYVIAIYLIFSCVIALLTVINFFYLDPLGLMRGYSDKVIKDFGSTIGNKNTIASYMSMFLPISVMVLVVNKKLYMRVLAGVSIIFAYTGALSANSSSVILGMIVAVPVMAIFSARSYDYLRRFSLAMTIMFLSGKILRLYSYFMDGNNKGYEFIQHFMIYDKLMYIPIIVFGLIYVLMLVFREKGEKHYPRKALTTILTVFTAGSVAAIIGAMIYFTVADTTSELGSFDRLLRFDDKWGTHRGFMWIRSMQEYGKFDIFKKLFGYGPDMAYYVLEPHFYELARRFGDSSTDCAHNEFINYLITQGALGLLAYLGILGSVIIRGLRKAKQDPLTLIFISAVICYAVQSTVNLYQPITTPLFFIFIAITEALNRDKSVVK